MRSRLCVAKAYILYINTASLFALLFSLELIISSLPAHLSIVHTLITIAYKLPSGLSTEFYLSRISHVRAYILSRMSALDLWGSWGNFK